MIPEEKKDKKNAFRDWVSLEWGLLKGGFKAGFVILFTLGFVFGGVILLFKASLEVLDYYAILPEDSTVLFMCCLVTVVLIYKYLVLPFGITLLEKIKSRK